MGTRWLRRDRWRGDACGRDREIYREPRDQGGRNSAGGESNASLVAQLHKLAGAAGFYDETEIAELAADLERRLEPTGGEPTNGVAITHDVERLVRLLRSRAMNSHRGLERD